MVRKTKEEAAATRQALLNAALIVFSQKGYAAARLEDVAEAAGVSRGAIYWHFRSKAELYNTLVGEVWSRGGGVVDRAIAEGGTFMQVTRRIMIRLLAYLEEDATYRAVVELTTLRTEYTPELEEGMEMKRQAMREIQQEMSRGFQEGIAAGEVRADLDPTTGALAMFSYLQGVSLVWLIDQQAFSLRERAPALVDVFIRGIAAQP